MLPLGDGAELRTKIKLSDKSILEAISIAPRLAEQIEEVWVRRNDPSDYKLKVEPGERNAFRATLLCQDGLKLGSTKAINATGSLKVWKGLNIFPGRLLGEPIGSWAEGSEQELRLYRYRSVMDHRRMFAARQIGQVPTLAPVPEDAVFQNTALLLQLRRSFPLNVWVVSRVLQFYCAKVLRASIVEDITAHWYKRQLALLPFPASPSEDLIRDLEAKGEALFLADRTVADRYRTVQAAMDAGARSLRDLIIAGDARTFGLDLTAVPTDDADVVEVVVDGEVIRGGQSWEAVVPDPEMRRWLAHCIARGAELHEQQFVRADVLNLAIPDDLPPAIAALNAFKADDPEAVFETALNKLDTVFGASLGLSHEQINYVQDQMRTDAFLRHISPM